MTTRPTDLRQQPGVCPECKGAGSMFEGSSGLDAKVCRICKGTDQQPRSECNGRCIGARRRDVRLWMRHNAGSYSTATELAEAADDVFRLPDGGLDNDTHWAWDEAVEAINDAQEFCAEPRPAQPEHDLGTRRYARKGAIYAYPWRDGFSLEGISLSDADRLAGHPKVGGMVAINPDDPMDRWYIAPEFFAKHYAEGQPAQPGSGEAKRVPLEEEAIIESALRFSDSEYQMAFREGYIRAMTIAGRRLTAAQQRIAALESENADLRTRLNHSERLQGRYPRDAV